MCVYVCIHVYVCVCVYVFVLAFICVCQLIYHLTQKHFDDQAKIIQTNIYNSTNMPTQTNKHTKPTNPTSFCLLVCVCICVSVSVGMYVCTLLGAVVVVVE